MKGGGWHIWSGQIIYFQQDLGRKIYFQVYQGQNIHFYPQQKFEKAKKKKKKKKYSVRGRGGGSEFLFRREAGQDVPCVFCYIFRLPVCAYGVYVNRAIACLINTPLLI